MGKLQKCKTWLLSYCWSIIVYLHSQALIKLENYQAIKIRIINYYCRYVIVIFWFGVLDRLNYRILYIKIVANIKYQTNIDYIKYLIVKEF